MVRLKRFELLTHGLEGRCSIRLSYKRILLTPFHASGRTLLVSKMERVMGIGPTRPAWKAGILPLNYTRIRQRLYILPKIKKKVKCFSDFFPTFCLFKTIFECNILPFTAKTELYNASALFIVLSDSKVISQMIENNIIDIILEGLEFPNNQLFLLAVDKLVSFSENSSTKLDFSMILEVLNQNDDCNSEKYHYLINRLNAIEGN